MVKFDPATGKQFKSSSVTQSYTNYFAEALIAEAEVDRDIVAIHAAMGGGTGLNIFQRRFPDRCFDVGIAEQHAVTFAAGLACEGIKPFCAIYSSFLQRAYDQVSVHSSLFPMHKRISVPFLCRDSFSSLSLVPQLSLSHHIHILLSLVPPLCLSHSI